MKSARASGGCGIGAALLLSGAAHAEGWQYTVTPYIWAPDLDVELEVRPNPQVSDTQQMFDDLGGAFLVQGEARRNRWSLLGEITYLDLSDDFTFGSAGVDAGWDLSGTMVSLGAGYAVYDENSARVEVVGGLRRWDFEATTDVASQRAEDDIDFIDPMVGLRVETPVGRGLMFLGQANIGGDDFGSQQQIDAIAQLRLPIRDNINVSAGYRYLKLDFEEGDVVSDSTVQGPFISFGFNF